MPLPWFASLLIGLAFNIAGYLLLPKQKAPKPPSVEDLQEPTAEAGREIPVIFGSMTTRSPNLIGAWDKSVVYRKARVGKK